MDRWTSRGNGAVASRNSNHLFSVLLQICENIRRRDEEEREFRNNFTLPFCWPIRPRCEEFVDCCEGFPVPHKSRGERQVKWKLDREMLFGELNLMNCHQFSASSGVEGERWDDGRIREQKKQFLKERRQIYEKLNTFAGIKLTSPPAARAFGKLSKLKWNENPIEIELDCDQVASRASLSSRRHTQLN